jgi:hypothetical protein
LRLSREGDLSGESSRSEKALLLIIPILSRVSLGDEAEAVESPKSLDENPFNLAELSTEAESEGLSKSLLVNKLPVGVTEPVITFSPIIITIMYFNYYTLQKVRYLKLFIKLM